MSRKKLKIEYVDEDPLGKLLYEDVREILLDVQAPQVWHEYYVFDLIRAALKQHPPSEWEADCYLMWAADENWKMLFTVLASIVDVHSKRMKSPRFQLAYVIAVDSATFNSVLIEDFAAKMSKLFQRVVSVDDIQKAVKLLRDSGVVDREKTPKEADDYEEDSRILRGEV